MTNALLAQTLGWSVSRVKYYVQKLKKSGKIKEKEPAVMEAGKYCKTINTEEDTKNILINP